MNYDEILKQLKIEGNPTPCARFTFSIPNAKEELVTAMSAVLGAMGERFVWLPEYDKVAEWLSANNGKRVTTVRKLRTREIAVGPLRNSDVATQVRQPDRNGRGLRVTECQYRRRN